MIDMVIEPEVPSASLGADPVVELTRRIAERLSAAAVRFADQWFVFDPAWQATTSPDADA
jgi:hypothetical protein